MKLNNKGSEEVIIGTDDVFISSNNSSLGNSLESILTKLDLDILDLKRNVKWLYKYGGVGGGGGSSVQSTKITCTLSYTDNNGSAILSKIEDGTIFNIKEGTSITVTCTITSTKSLNEYTFSLNNLKTTIKATDINGVLTTVPDGNTVYTITVIGETTVSLTFNVFTKVMDTRHSIVLSNGSSIYSDSSIYKSLIDGANYTFTLVNNLPNTFDYAIDSITINSTEVSFTLEETINSLIGSKTLVTKVPISEHFSEYDIYQIQVNYTFGSDKLSIIDSFIYQSDNVFVYCWSSNVSVYKQSTASPITSNLYNNVINFRVYPGINDPITLLYSITISDGTDTNNIVALSGTLYSYTVVNNVKDNTVHEIILTFNVMEIEYKYYLYLTQPLDMSYFFNDDNGNSYYQAIYCDTEDLNTSIIDFPKKDVLIQGSPIHIDKLQEYTLKKVSSTFGTINGDLVSLFVCSNPQSLGNLRQDALFSFGLKYYASNYEAPILSIKSNVNNITKSIDLYKNKIVYNSAETDICIPNDDNYHLVLLYFKSDYRITGDFTNIGTKDAIPVVVLYIDGVQETKPIEILNFFIEASYTSIVYYVGLWYFNHIGVATFNGMPNEYSDTETKQNCVAKYLLDLDPIIPSNYYQTYKTKVLNKPVTKKFGKEIYSVLSNKQSSKSSESLWINYFSYNGNLHLNKFINIDAASLINLAPDDMEAYCIYPESTNLSLIESGFDVPPDKHFNQFLYNTFKSYGENSKISKVKCNVKKWVNGQWTDLISNVGASEEALIQFYIIYQGSSTLLFSAKNFELGAEEIQVQEESLPVYFTPDVKKFPYMESSFNLKADIVDSSHSNNVVIGNFVNDYIKSPFNTTEKTYHSCLTGKPILLFMLNNATDDSGNIILDDSIIFLGIYSLNLSRKSVHNLGYATLIDSKLEEIKSGDSSVTLDRCCDNITKFHILQTSEKDLPNSNFAVAEVLDNGILYDYSQFDSALLANQVLGDFYVCDNDRISKEYSTVFIKPFLTLAKIIYNKLITSKCFQTINLQEILKDSKIEGLTDIYYTKDGLLTLIPSDAIIIDSDTLNGLTENLPYHTTYYKDKKTVGKITDPLVLFHLVCNSLGLPRMDVKTTYYYVEKLNELTYNPEIDTTKIDVETAVLYFIVCMAFAMVDSVQKNLTLKCPDTKYTNKWYMAFYDMDTAFGVTNSGGLASFLAFSDYVSGDGSIIQDYAPLHASGLFDTPSSFLFLYAKYIDLITTFEMSSTLDGYYPFKEWSTLRGKLGSFSSGTAFCEKYVDDYFGDINPLIWNLNYAYKYFSETLNSDANETESSKFNGTRRFARKEFLNKRFRYLDVLFGFNNSQTIGHSTTTITNGNSDIPDNYDITIKLSMFPLFKKGFNGSISANITDNPKTPVVLKVSESISKLFMTDDTGSATITGNVTSNTDCGFYGTNELTSVSECGLFMTASGTHTIENDKIKTINISKGSEGSISLDISKLTSVTDIKISNSSVLNFKGSITIKGASQNTLQLNSIIIENVKCTAITLSNINVNTITLNKCVADTLSVDAVSTSKFTSTQNTISTESWSIFNVDNSITITNSVCTALSISNSTLKNGVSYTPSVNFSSLTLDQVTTTSFTLGLASKLSKLKVSKCTINAFILSNGASVVSNQINDSDTLELGFLNTEIILSISGLSKVKTLKLGNVTICILTTNAFKNCYSLESINNWENIEFTIKGNYAFTSANTLLKDIMLKCNLNLNSNYLGIFACNSLIDNLFVIDWFSKNQARSLTDLFAACPNIELAYDEENLQLPELFSDFETAFIGAIERTTNIQSTITGTFYYSNMNILTKRIADALNAKKCFGYNCALGFPINSSIATSVALYVEKNVFNGFTSVIIGSYTLLAYDGKYVFPYLYLFDQDGIIKETKMSDWFTDDSKIVTLSYFNPRTQTSTELGDISFDFENGFPKDLSNILLFGWALSNPVNVINMENTFNKSSKTPTLGSSSFSYCNLNTISNGDNFTNLFDFLFKEDSNGNITAKVNYTPPSTYKSGPYFNFNKLLTQELLLKILKYYKDHNQTDISWIFNGAVVTDCESSDILENKLSSFNTFIGTFRYCRFKDTHGLDLPINILKAFADKDSTKYTIVNTLTYAFYGCNLVRLTERLPIQNVNDMHEAFYNCSFTSSSTPSTIINTWNISGIPNIKVYTDKEFLLLPDNFFAICKAGCNLEKCFANDSFSYSYLTGYLPDEDTIGLSKVYSNNSNITDIFKYCNITYKKVINKTNSYRIFPGWYSSLSFTGRFTMYTAFPPLNNLDTLYIFEDADKIIGNYGEIITLPPKTSTLYWYALITGDSVKNYGLLRVSETSNTFPAIDGGTYKNMIRYVLSLILRMGNDTLVITNLSKLIESGQVTNTKDMPIIFDIVDSSAGEKAIAAIFNGDTIDSNVKNIVLNV